MKPIPETGPAYDAEEQTLIEATEAEDHVPVSVITPDDLARYKHAALATLHENRVNISLDLAEGDLARLKARALREGMPYQTLIASILHKAANS